MGVADHAASLPEASGKARLGGFVPDLERVVALAPDLAVVSRDGTDRKAAERLAALGIRVVVTDGTSLSGVEDDVRRVADAIGEGARGAALASGMKARAQAARERAARRPGPPLTAVAVIWPDPPVLAGPSSFVGDVLAAARLENAVPASAGEWPRVTLETLLTWSPALVVRPDTSENRDAFARALSPGGSLSLLPAVRAGRIVTLPGDLLERPGPRLVDALEAIVARLAELAR